jgi:hypothetical protein
MSVILWAVAALLGGFLALAIGARRVQRASPVPELPPGETLPPTVLQRLARGTVAVGLIVALAAGAIIAWAGPRTFYEDDTTRGAVTLLLLLSLIILASFSFRAGAWMRQSTGPLDERDRAILEKAPAIEGTPMLITLVLWTIGLQEAFWSAGSVPLVYLNLVFWSVLVVKALALPVGVLIGYRRS